MTKYVPPDDILNIYYNISKKIPDIVNIEKDEDNNFDKTDLENIQNIKKIQWSPDRDKHLNKTFNFNINGSGTQKIKVIDKFNISGYEISNGIRKSRNTNSTDFIISHENDKNILIEHDGSTSNNEFAEIATDTTELSNSQWVFDVNSFTWTYNSEQNNIRMGIVDRTDNNNYIEFAETEGKTPRIQAKSVNGGSNYTEIDFSGNTPYDFDFSMSKGEITAEINGISILSHDGYPEGQYAWFMMNEQDNDTNSGEKLNVEELILYQ